MESRADILYMVIPCYNEQEVLPVTAPMFRAELQILMDSFGAAEDSRILFVDDGSKDNTWKIITELAAEDPFFTGIRQSRNRGHQSSVLAGLMEAMPDLMLRSLLIVTGRMICMPWSR